MIFLPQRRGFVNFIVLSFGWCIWGHTATVSGVSGRLLGKDWISSMLLAMLVAMSGLLPSPTIFASRSISMFVCGFDVNVKNDIYVNIVAAMCSCGLMRIYSPISFIIYI